MIYGFDWWKTLSHHQETLMPLIRALALAGHDIWVISACGYDRSKSTPEAIWEALDRYGLKSHVSVQMVIWDIDQKDAPRLKYEACKELGVDLFFDDREDTCDYLSSRGIPCFRSPFYKHFENKLDEKNL